VSAVLMMVVCARLQPPPGCFAHAHSPLSLPYHLPVVCLNSPAEPSDCFQLDLSHRFSQPASVEGRRGTRQQQTAAVGGERGAGLVVVTAAKLCSP
jgi:hypothetical protein